MLQHIWNAEINTNIKGMPTNVNSIAYYHQICGDGDLLS
jgi:hypothetical protein